MPITDPDRIRRHIFLPGWNQKHHVYEQMAHAIEQPAPIDCWDLFQTDAYQEELHVSAYVPGGRSRHSLKPVVVFGNTRLPGLSIEEWRNFLSDIASDVFPLSIGYYRWCYNEGRIVSLLRRLHADYGPIDVVGHSLGGALAQTCACVRPTYLDHVVTFGSPGIARYVHRKFRQQRSRHVIGLHYHFEGDTVTEAGDAFFPGLRPRFTFAASWVEHAANEIVDSLLDGVSDDIRARVAVLMLRVAREIADIYLAHTSELYEPFYDWRRPPEGGRANRLIEQHYGSLTLLGTRQTRGIANAVELARMATGIVRGTSVGPFGLSVSDLLDRLRYVAAWDATKEFFDHFPPNQRPSLTSAPIPEALVATDLFPDASFFHAIRASQNFRENLNLLYPDVTGRTVVQVPSGDAHVLITTDGHLTDNGIAALRRGWPAATSGKADDAIDREFFGNPEQTGADGRADWLEWLVGQELKLFYQADNRSDTNNIAESHGALQRVYIVGNLVDRPESEGHSHAELRTVINLLRELNRANYFRTEESESQRSTQSGLVAYHIPTLVEERAQELLPMKVYEFLRRRVWRREGRDESLYQAYLRAHRFHLSCSRTDPLRLLRDRDLRLRCCTAQPEPYRIADFARDARDYGRVETDVPADRLGLERRHFWYTFLFKLRRDGRLSGHGFVADDHADVRRCFGSSMPCSTGKNVVDRRPDFVVIIPERRIVSVIDPTFRWRYLLHNFKTEFYASAIRFLLPESDPAWQVDGYDYYAAKLARRTSYTE